MKKGALLFALLIMGVAGAQGQTLEECRKMARENYPQIKQFNLIEATEQYNLSNARRAWIPQVTFQGQATYQSATPTYPEAFNQILAANGVSMAGIEKDQYKLAIDISQNIWDGGQSKAAKEVAKAEGAEQKSRLEVQLYELQTRVDNLYFGILLLEERIKQTGTMINLLESNFNRMKTWCANGAALQADADLLEAELISAKQTLGKVEASKESYRRILELFIGKQLADRELAKPAMPDAVSRISARPELEMFESQQNMLDARRKELNSATMPRLSLFAQGYYGYPGMDMFKSMVSNSFTPNALVGVRMIWNIGAFNTRRNNIGKLEIAKKQIDVQRNVFLFNSQIQETEQDGEIARLRKAIEEDNRIIELRQSVRKAAESKLQNGVIDATDLLQKITDETNAEINRSTHQIELLQTIYKLKNTLNQ